VHLTRLLYPLRACPYDHREGKGGGKGVTRLANKRVPDFPAANRSSNCARHHVYKIDVFLILFWHLAMCSKNLLVFVKSAEVS